MEIELRPWTFDDLPDLVKHAHNRKISDNLLDSFPYPYTEVDGRRFLARVSSANPRQTLAISQNGKAIGAIGIHPQKDVFRLNGELGYWLAEPFWGQGLMTRALELMLNYCFKNFELQRIFARPFGKNIASQKALEKAGFKLEHRISNNLIKNGVLEDELIYSYLRPVST